MSTNGPTNALKLRATNHKNKCPGAKPLMILTTEGLGHPHDTLHSGERYVERSQYTVRDLAVCLSVSLTL